MMSPYLHGELAGSHIIDLAMTQPMLQRALDLTQYVLASPNISFLLPFAFAFAWPPDLTMLLPSRAIASEGGVVLFVGTRPQFESTIRKKAKSCGEYYVSRKWMGGTLTNSTEVSTCRMWIPAQHIPT